MLSSALVTRFSVTNNNSQPITLGFVSVAGDDNGPHKTDAIRSSARGRAGHLPEFLSAHALAHT
jgi:hypothetical protein